MKKRSNEKADFLKMRIKGADKQTDEKIIYLFWYTVFSLVRDDRYKTLTEKEASDHMKDFPRTKIVYFHLKDSPTPKPNFFKGRKYVIQEVTGGHEEVSNLIFSVTGVRIPEVALMQLKTKALIEYERIPLVDKIRLLKSNLKIK